MQFRYLCVLSSCLFLGACNTGASKNQTLDNNAQTPYSIQGANGSTSNSATSYPKYLRGYSVLDVCEINGTIYAGTANGVFISKDAGKSWSLKTTLNGLDANTVTRITGHDNTIYAIVDGYADVSTDAGQTWRPLQTTYTGAYNGVAYSNGSVYLSASFGNNGIVKQNFINVSKDDGKTWASLPLQSNVVKVNGLFANNDTLYYVDPWTSSIFKTSDLGKTYNYVGLITPNGETPYLYSIVANGDEVIVGIDHGVAVTNNAGPWSSSGFKFLDVSNGLGANDVKAMALDANKKLLAATESGLSIYQNGNSNLTTFKASNLNHLTSSNVLSVFAGPSHVIVGTNDGIAIYNNSTSNKNFFYSLHDSNVTSLTDSTSDDLVYISTYTSGVLAVSENYIDSFRKTNSNSGIASNAVNTTYVDNNSIYIGTNIGLSISHDNGNSWSYKNQSNAFSGSVLSVAVRGANIYAATYGSGLMVSNDSGNNWKRATLSHDNDVINYTFLDGQTVYACPKNGGIAVSSDDGKSWKNIFSSNNVTSLFATGFTIYAGTSDGLYISYDSGKSWQHKTKDIGNNAVVSIYVSAGNIYLGLDNGNLAISLDAENFVLYPVDINTDGPHPINAVYELDGELAFGYKYFLGSTVRYY